LNYGDAVWTGHARTEIARRGIDEADVLAVLTAPEQVERVRPGRIVAQSRLKQGDPPQTYLFRVVLDIDRKPPEIVTAYL